MHRSTAATLGCCNRWRTRFDPPEMQTAPLEKLYVNVPAWVIIGSMWVFVRETLQRIHRKLLGFTWFYMVLKFYYITSFDNISFKPSVGHLEQALGMWRCGSNSRHYSLQGLDNFVTVTSATASGVWPIDLYPLAIQRQVDADFITSWIWISTLWSTDLALDKTSFWHTWIAFILHVMSLYINIYIYNYIYIVFPVSIANLNRWRVWYVDYPNHRPRWSTWARSFLPIRPGRVSRLRTEV